MLTFSKNCLSVKRQLIIVLPLIMLFLYSCEKPSPYNYASWNAYAGTKNGNRYSTNEQIDRHNVKKLKIAWRYSSHDKDSLNRSQDQCNPIIVGNTLYGISPKLKLFALNAATGKEKWVFDPAKEEKNDDPSAYMKVSRGVMFWQNEKGEDKRILYAVGSHLYAINANNGNPVSSFGKEGYIELKENLDALRKGDFFLVETTPGVIYKNLVIVGMRIGGAPGNVRAFDVRTGERKWIFHVIPHPGEVGYESWENKDAWKKFGEANSWAGMSLDVERGIVYVPTGSADPDFYGGARKGSNLFGCSLIALEAATGKYIWHFQAVHHDLWDRDLPANPNLVTLTKDGKKIDAVAQITKHGYIFVFDRANGQPVFPINEVPVPQNALPGETPWPTQPIPELPEAFARQKFDSSDINNLFPETHNELVERYKMVKYKTPFTPPSKEGTWVFPGFDGGGEWGGAAVDVESGIMYVNATELPWALIMIDVPKASGGNSLLNEGENIYNSNCIQCHGPERKGNGSSFPSLLNLPKKYTKEQVKHIIENGRNMMPSFGSIPDNKIDALVGFLLHNPNASMAQAERQDVIKSASVNTEDNDGPDSAPYTINGWNRFLDKNGYPGIKPPWGTLNAVDLNNGKLLWKVPLGEYPELTKKGIPKTGTENYGGPLVTKGGLVFIAASKDEMIRAFDKTTGEELWKAKLPAAGFATPATYMVEGKQYVVIACGGGKIGNKSGDEYVAFALP